mgnify:CR=1 FL=1
MEYEEVNDFYKLANKIDELELAEEENQQQNDEQPTNIEQEQEPEIEENQEQPDTQNTSTHTTTQSGRISKPPTLIQPTWKGQSYVSITYQTRQVRK